MRLTFTQADIDRCEDWMERQGAHLRPGSNVRFVLRPKVNFFGDRQLLRTLIYTVPLFGNPWTGEWEIVGSEMPDEKPPEELAVPDEKVK